MVILYPILGDNEEGYVIGVIYDNCIDDFEPYYNVNLIDDIDISENLYNGC